MQPLGWLVRLVVLIAAGAAVSGQGPSVRELTILHFNDLHARIRPDDNGLGGFPQLAAALGRERDAAAASLTFFAGDLVQGTSMSTLFEGVPEYDLANHLGIDAACLGNHEFDYGWEKIGAMAGAARFPVLAANVVNAAGERLMGPPYVIRDAGGVRVAVIGALLEGTGPWPPWHAAPIVDTLRPIVADAKRQADLVVVVGHVDPADVDRILRDLPDVGVVVAGHQHTGLQQEIDVGGRLAVNVQSFGREFGRLRLRYDTNADRIVSHEWTRIRVDGGRYAADPATEAAVRAWEAKLSAILDVPIGRASRRVEREELRALIQEALRQRYSAEVGYISRIVVRDAVPAGDLLARHMWNVSPLDDRVMALDVSGERLLELIDPSQPPDIAPAVGAIVKGRRYRVATADFVGQRWAVRYPDIRIVAEDEFLADMLVEWVRARRVIP
jgi:2',3'-cyclic-nucleotide 2'-phosphodiesterase (5'-nucleotidase family)